MKVLTISICLVVLSYGCSKELDTTTKESSGTYTIKRWDGENWIETADSLTISLTWRYISYLELNDKWSVQIKGEYTLELYNPNDNYVEFRFDKFTFMDKDGIAIYKDNSFSQIKRNVRAGGTDTYLGAFEIELDNIDIANKITDMVVWGSASIPVE